MVLVITSKPPIAAPTASEPVKNQLIAIVSQVPNMRQVIALAKCRLAETFSSVILKLLYILKQLLPVAHAYH